MSSRRFTIPGLILAALLGSLGWWVFGPTPLERTDALLAEERWEEAEEAARGGLARASDEEQADLQRALGRAHSRQGEHAEALEAFAAARALHPDDDELRHRMAIAHVGIGRDHEAAGETELALAAYREAVSLSPEIPHGHRALVDTLRNLRRTDESIEAARAASEVAPHDPFFRVALAWLLATHPDPDRRDAETALELAHEVLIRDRTPETLETYAVSLAAQGNYTAALKFELDAIQLAGGRDAPGFDERRKRLKAFVEERPYIEPSGDGDS